MTYILYSAEKAWRYLSYSACHNALFAQCSYACIGKQASDEYRSGRPRQIEIYVQQNQEWASDETGMYRTTTTV